MSSAEATAPAGVPGAALASRGMIEWNPAPAPLPAQRTLVVLGVQRGGTSMVAELLHMLGVPMGDVAPPTYEDKGFATKLRRYARELAAEGRPGQQTLALLREVTDGHDAAHALWGFKFPDVICPELYAMLRYPMFVSVHRDPVSICARLQTSGGADGFAAMPSILALQQAQSEFLLTTSYPCLAISYEKALLNPRDCVDQIASFAGLAVTDAQRDTAVQKIHPSPKAYLEGTRQVRIIGNLDYVRDGIVCGWAADTHDLDRPLSVRVLIDGQTRLEGRVDRQRRDVQKYLGAQYCPTERLDFGFMVAVPPALRDGKAHRVDVEIADGEDYRIGASGQDYLLS